jgi:hypothetical protein
MVFHRPLLFVSNHPILGFEFPLLLSELYKQTGIFLRALTDHSHWQVRFFRGPPCRPGSSFPVCPFFHQIPVNAQILRDVIGAAEGTQRNVDLLLSSGAAVLVYPGGARETFKRVGEPKYMLHWEGRLGFARVSGYFRQRKGTYSVFMGTSPGCHPTRLHHHSMHLCGHGGHDHCVVRHAAQLDSHPVPVAW